MRERIINLKVKILSLLWKFKPIWRNYCWANAVMWAYGDRDWESRKADHECFYCLACNTEEEIEDYQNGNHPSQQVA